MVEYGAWLSTMPARKIEDTSRILKRGWEEGATGGSIRSEVKRSDWEAGESRMEKAVIDEKAAMTILPNEEHEARVKKQDENKVKEGKQRKERDKKENVSLEGEDVAMGGKEDNGGGEREISPDIKEDLTKAIVVFGCQPLLTDVTEGQRQISLKREAEEREEIAQGKRRRIAQEEGRKVITLERKGQVKKQGRKSLRVVKKMSRRNIKRQGDQGVEWITHEAIEVTMNKMNVTEREGEGGWPETATRGA